MKRIPALVAAGLLVAASSVGSHATQLANARFLSNSTAQDALELQNSLSDFRTFLRYGCADTRGNSGGSRLAGSFTICGSDSIESANHNMHRALVLSSVPVESLKLYTGVDSYDFKTSKYRSRMDWVASALDRRDSRDASAVLASARQVAVDDGIGRTQVASLVLNADESGSVAAAAETTASGSVQVGDAASVDVAGSVASGDGGFSVPTAAGGTVTEYTDGSAGAGTGGVVASLDGGSGVAAGSGAVSANEGVTAQGLSSDGVMVSDTLSDAESVASVDGVPSASDSFHVQLDADSANGLDGSQSDVPLPAALPLLAGAVGLLGGLRKRKLRSIAAP